MSCCSKCKKKKEEPKGPPPVPMRVLLGYASKNKIILMVLGTICALAHGGMLPGFSIVFGELFNIFFEKKGQALKNDLVKIAVAFVGLGVGNFLLGYLALMSWGIVGEDVTRKLTNLLFASITKQNIAFFDKHSTGELTNFLGSDMTLVGNGVGDKIASFIIFISQALTGVIIAFVYGWKLTLVLLSLSPLMMAASALQVKFLAHGAQSQQGAKAKAATLAGDTISGIKTVYSFVWESEAVRRFSILTGKSYKEGVKKSHLGGIGFGASFGMMFFVYALAFWYGGTLVADGEMPVGDLLIVFFSIVIAAMGLGQGSQFNPDFAKAQGSAAKIFEIINRVPDINPDDPGVEDVNIEGNIVLKNVWFTYPIRKKQGEFSDAGYEDSKKRKFGKKKKKKQKKIEEEDDDEKPNEPTITGLNLEIKKGNVVALVGPSGCGKSTTISLLERFYDVTSGSIEIDGRDIREYKLRWLRSQIGLVAQEPILFNCSIIDNIRWGKKDATKEEVIEAAKMANAHNFISEFDNGYDTQVGEKGGQMSGGQKQRIAIARAVLKDPKILLLDEATSALDNESEAIVQEALEKLMKNRTTVVIAHRLSTIKNADKIAVFSKGKVVEIGSHKELLSKKGAYWKLVVRQMSEEERKTFDKVVASSMLQIKPTDKDDFREVDMDIVDLNDVPPNSIHDNNNDNQNNNNDHSSSSNDNDDDNEQDNNNSNNSNNSSSSDNDNGDDNDDHPLNPKEPENPNTETLNKWRESQIKIHDPNNK